MLETSTRSKKHETIVEGQRLRPPDILSTAQDSTAHDSIPQRNPLLLIFCLFSLFSYSSILCFMPENTIFFTKKTARKSLWSLYPNSRVFCRILVMRCWKSWNHYGPHCNFVEAENWSSAKRNGSIGKWVDKCLSSCVFSHAWCIF